MQQRDGLFITIEGTDGSGKDTQTELLKQHLEKAGYEIVQLNFPQHGQPAAHFVDQYIQGAYGSSIQVGPYTACLFYALDYYDAAPTIRKALAAGKAVIATRFSASNMANHGAKITHPEERRGFFIWLDNLQFRMLNTPRPTMSFVLRVPPAVAQERVRQKHDHSTEQRTDAVQLAELDQLQLAANVYDDMCQLFPKDFIRVDCARSNVLLDPEQIHDLIWGKITPLVPEPESIPETVTPQVAIKPDDEQPPKTITRSLFAAVRSSVVPLAFPSDPKAPEFYTPTQLDTKTKEFYQQRMAQLLELYKKIATTLQDSSDPSKQGLARLALPVAALATVQDAPNVTELAPETKLAVQTTLAAITADLQKNYSDESEPMRLTSYWPRNELDIVPAILYEYSNQSFGDIQHTVSGWPYDKKSFVLRSYIQEPAANKRALESVLYSWDVLTEFNAIADLRTLQLAGLDWQPLSPRLGYDVPAPIEQAGLADDFERCFDLSLEMYSSLQSAGYDKEAQYATLLGHRVRAKITASARDMLNLRTYSAEMAAYSTVARLATGLVGQLAAVHPLIAAAMQPAKPVVAQAAPQLAVSPARPKRTSKRASTKRPLDK